MQPEIIKPADHQPGFVQILTSPQIAELILPDPGFYDIQLSNLLDPPLPEPTCPASGFIVTGAEMPKDIEVIRTIPCSVNSKGHLVIGAPNPQEAGIDPMQSDTLFFIRPPGVTEKGNRPVIIAYVPSVKNSGHLDAESLCPGPSPLNTLVALGVFEWLDNNLFNTPYAQNICFNAKNAIVPVSITMSDGKIHNVLLGTDGSPFVLLFGDEYLLPPELSQLLRFGGGEPVAGADLAMEELTQLASDGANSLQTFSIENVDISHMPSIPEYIPPVIAPIQTDVPPPERAEFVVPTVLETQPAIQTPVPELVTPPPLSTLENIQIEHGNIIETEIFADHTTNMKVILVNPDPEYSYTHRFFSNIETNPTSESIYKDLETIKSRQSTWGKIKDWFYNVFHREDRLPEPATILDTKTGFYIQDLKILFFDLDPKTMKLTVVATHGDQKSSGLIIETTLPIWEKFTSTKVVDGMGNVDHIKSAVLAETFKDLHEPQATDSYNNNQNDAHFMSPDMPYALIYFTSEKISDSNIHSPGGQLPKTGFIYDSTGNLYSSTSIPHNYHGRPTGKIIMIGNEPYMATAVDPIEFPDLIKSGAYQVFIPLSEYVKGLTDESIQKTRELQSPTTP